MDRDRRTLWLRRSRRALRVTGAVLGWTLAAVVIAVLTVLLLPASRRALLDKGLELAAGALPGELAVARADWPGLGRLELDGVLWTDGPDTLAAADTLRIHVDISDLFGRDLTVRQVLVAGIRADVPAIQERLPAAVTDSTTMTPDEEPTGPPPFPRAGALPPIPSLAVDRLAVRRATVIAAPEHTVRLDSLTLSADLRHGRRPTLGAALRVHPHRDLGVAWRLAGHGDADSLVLEVAPLWVDATRDLPDPGALPLSGRLALPMAMLDSLAAGRLPTWPSLVVSRLGIAGETGAWTVDARLDGREPGFLQVESALPEAPRAMLAALMAAGTDSVAPGLLDSLSSRWGRDGHPGARLRVEIDPPPAPGPVLSSYLVIDGDLRLPALATLAPLLPPQLDADDLGPLFATIDLRYDGRTDPPRYDARIDLGATEWIDAAYIAASGDTSSARLDSLLVRLPGLALEATGAIDRDSLRATVALTVTDGSLLDRWDDPLLADLDPRANFTLDAVTAWPLPELDLPATLDPSAPLSAIPTLPSRVVFRGDLNLPPLSRLGPLLPPQLVVDDLGPIALDMDMMYDGLGGPPRFAVRADFGRTEWLDALRFAAAGDQLAVEIDSMVVRLPGLELSAVGAADPDSVRLELHLVLPDSTLLQRWNDPALAGIEPRADISLKAAGAWPLPRLELAGSLGLVSPQLTVPELDIDALAAADTIVLDLTLPTGLTAAQQELTFASLRFDGAVRDSLRVLRGDLRTEARAPRAGLLLAARIDARDLASAPAGTVAVDTLSLDLDGRGLANTHPFQVVATTADSLLEISDLELTGNLGRLSIDGRVTPDSLEAELALALQFALEAIRSMAPTGVQPYLPEGTLTADGELTAAGAPTAPWAGGRIRVGIADNPALGGLSAETHLSVGGSGEAPAGIDPGRARWRQHSARLDLSLRDADTLLTRISALVPLPRPGGGKDSVDVRIDADAMDLARLEPLLPGGTSLRGRLDADTRVAGLMAPDETKPDLALSGGLRLTDMRLGAPDGSWMSMEGKVDLDGTSLSPVIRGGLDIRSGLIRIPEPPPSLLPASGEALLWQSSAPLPDSLATIAAVADTADSKAPVPAFMPDLTFTINCPGSLWLRGQGLDVELSGDLALHLREGKPAIEGELEARQGTMKQLGRVFNLERGRIIFYADEDELNPELDLALGVRVSSYSITIALTGTANEPKLEFSSSPDLGDGDIISVLLFGKTSDELDEGQSGLMAERAAQVALAYGSVQLQERLARELGVDVLSIAPRADDSSKSSLTVGKYLNPKVMVRYEQVLDEESAFYVHLDYSLTESQEWKLHTQVSQGEASGVEIKWEKDW